MLLHFPIKLCGCTVTISIKKCYICTLLYHLTVKLSQSIFHNLNFHLGLSVQKIRNFFVVTLATRKNRLFLLVHMTVALRTFPPSTLAALISFHLCFFSFLASPFLGSDLKKQPLLSMFQIFFRSDPLPLSLSIHDSTVTSDTSRGSPDNNF